MTKKLGRNYIVTEVNNKSVPVRDFNNNPATWDYLVNTLSPYFPDHSLVVAGGAVRDCVLGYKPKDIDIFIVGEPPRYEIDMEIAFEQVRDNHGKPSEIGREGLLSSSAAFVNRDGRQRAQLQFPAIEIGCDVDLVYSPDICSSTRSLLNSFDYGLVRIAYEDGFIHEHTSFNEMDQNRETFIVNKNRLKGFGNKDPEQRYNLWKIRNRLLDEEWLPNEIHTDPKKPRHGIMDVMLENGIVMKRQSANNWSWKKFGPESTILAHRWVE